VRSGPGAARTILLFTSLVLGPLNSLVWYVPSLRYTRFQGWRIHCGVEVTESSTNKQHIIILLGLCDFMFEFGARFWLLVRWDLGYCSLFEGMM